MLPRFFAPDLDPSSPCAALPVDEGRHLTRVLRLGAGQEIAVFDGRGVEYRAAVEVAVRHKVTVRLLERLPDAAHPPVPVTVVQAVLKGSSMDDAVRDATMLGAHAIAPVLTAHCDVKAAFVTRPEALERWRRVALASVKQSRRATLPEVHATVKFTEWIRAAPGGLKLLFVEPSAAVQARPIGSLIEDPMPQHASVLLGPEGGWAPAEVEAALGAGCVPVALGPLTIRAESMPVAALAGLTAVWDHRRVPR